MGNGGLIPLLRRVPRWLREIAFIAIVYVGYELSRGVTGSTFGIARRNGWDILHWERTWGLAPEQLLTHALISVTPLAVVAAYFYSTMHYVITPVVLVWMYRCHSAAYRPARTALAISTVFGLIGFYLLPTAPPRLLAKAGIPDALFHVRHWGWWGGEGSVPRGLGSLTNQFAAMPSLHVGWALWCGYLIYRYSSRGWIRVLGILYPVLTTIVVLATGNHYLLDAIAGAIVVAMGAVVTLGLGRAGLALRQLRADGSRTVTASQPVATPLPASLFRELRAPALAADTRRCEKGRREEEQPDDSDEPSWLDDARSGSSR